MNRKNVIDGKLMHKMLMSGFANLSHNKNYLNEINVFPVSDGDTGTNMKNTFGTGVTALKGARSFDDTFSEFVKGMLLGSRGNSGFILSQYFLGIREYTKEKNTVSVFELSAALQHAYQVAYKAVLNPVEGTMLTLMREGIKGTLPKISADTSLKDFFDILVGEMFICVQKTFKQMDLLRDNNVLDSGALGLYLIFDGMKRALCDDLQYFDCEQSGAFPVRTEALVKNVSFFRYCTQFILRMKEVKDNDYFVDLLVKKGDSIVLAANENILNVHIHTNRPQEVMDTFSEYGDIAVKKVDDLFFTQEFAKLQQRKHKGFAVVAFTSGEGNAILLEQLGADVAFSVPFGHSPDEQELQTLTEGFLKENLIVFPNDKEIQERFRRIKWFSNLQNLYVVETDGLPKTFFTLSSLVFPDTFENIVKTLESLRKKRIFQASIKTATVGDRVRYSGRLENKTVANEDFTALLDTIAGEEALRPYSTVVAFGGKHCHRSDADILCAHFEKNSNLEFTFFDGRHHAFDFIIGAF